MAVSVECAVCLNNYDDPRNLPCGHTFCKLCIQLLIDASNNMKCPMDEKTFNVPGGRAENLAQNFAMIKVIDDLKMIANALQDVEICSAHANKEAEFFCESCSTAFCSKCVTKHKTHNFSDYHEALEKSAVAIGQLQQSMQSYRAETASKLAAAKQAVKAQVGASKMKFDNAKQKVDQIKAELNSAAAVLLQKALEIEKKVSKTLDTAHLDSLQQAVDKLCVDAAQLPSTKKLEQRLALTNDVASRFEKCRVAKVESLDTSGVATLFNDSALIKSLDAILDATTSMKRSLANDQPGFLSLKAINQAEYTPKKSEHVSGILNSQQIAVFISTSTGTKLAFILNNHVTVRRKLSTNKEAFEDTILHNVPPLWESVSEVCLQIEKQCSCAVAHAIRDERGINSWLIKFDPKSFKTRKTQVTDGLVKLSKYLKIEAIPFADPPNKTAEQQISQELNDCLKDPKAGLREKVLLFDHVPASTLEDLPGITSDYQIQAIQAILNELTKNQPKQDDGHAELYNKGHTETVKKQPTETETETEHEQPAGTASLATLAPNSTFNVVLLDKNLYTNIKQSPHWNSLLDWARSLQLRLNADVFVEETSNSEFELSCLKSSGAGSVNVDDAVSQLHDMCKQFEADLLKTKKYAQQIAIAIPPIFKHFRSSYDELFKETLQFCRDTFKDYDKSFSLQSPSERDSDSHLYINVYSVAEPQLSKLQWKVRLFVRHFVLLRVANLPPTPTVQSHFELKSVPAYEYSLTGYDQVGADGSKQALRIFVYDEIMTPLCVDAVVNAANDRLNHGSGIAGALRTAAGDAFDKESQDYVAKNGPVSLNKVVETGAYGLACETVFHVVGPDGRRESEHRKFHALLKGVYKELFYYAGQRVQSIAVPLISSGVFAGKFSKEQCAAAMWAGLVGAAEKGELGSVNEIHLVNFDRGESVRAIVRAATMSQIADYVSPVRTPDSSATSSLTSSLKQLFMKQGQSAHPLRHPEALKYVTTSVSNSKQATTAVRIVQRLNLPTDRPLSESFSKVKLALLESSK